MSLTGNASRCGRRESKWGHRIALMVFLFVPYASLTEARAGIFPELFVSYAYQLQTNSHFLQRDKSEGDDSTQDDFLALHAALVSAGCELVDRMAYSTESYLSRGDIAGQVLGVWLSTGEDPRKYFPSTNVLFVIRNAGSARLGYLVILSSLGPDRTTILSLDDHLRAKVLYDSATRDTLECANGDRATLGSVSGIRVLGEGLILLQEGMAPGGRQVVDPPLRKRMVILDMNEGKEMLKLQDPNIEGCSGSTGLDSGEATKGDRPR